MWEMDYDAAASHWEKKDADSVHMEPAALKEKIEAFIGAHNTCALATASRDCVRNTPIEKLVCLTPLQKYYCSNKFVKGSGAFFLFLAD